MGRAVGLVSILIGLAATGGAVQDAFDPLTSVWYLQLAYGLCSVAGGSAYLVGLERSTRTVGIIGWALLVAVALVPSSLWIVGHPMLVLLGLPAILMTTRPSGAVEP